MKKSNEDPNAHQVEEILPEVQQELSRVTANPKQPFIIIGLLCLLIGGAIAYFYFDSSESSQNKTIELPNNISKPTEQINDIPAIPQLPVTPKLIKPSVSTPPPLIPNELKKIEDLPPPTKLLQEPVNDTLAMPKMFDDKGTAKLMEDEEEQKRKEAKWRSSIILIAGVPNKKTPEEIQQEADFKCRGNMELLLPKGKIIEAVLESAINSDFGGEVKAIVSKDVYAENGKAILIRKGSKVFGDYSIGIDGAYGRVAITWHRIDLAGNCYSVNISSPTIDNLGRGGAQGRVDNKYKEKLTNVVLSSAFNIALANTLDKIVPPIASSTVATTNQDSASQLNNIAFGIFNDTTQTAATKIPLICAQVQAVITDKTSTAYTSFAATCSTAITAPTTTDPAQSLAAIMAAVNAASTSLLTETDKQLTPTQAQEASKQAFTDITDTIKDMIVKDNFKPTITINQGTLIKIYVNKDYNFPKVAFNKTVKIK